MKKTFSVKNWDEFQHYKDRNPPWIKLHNHLLDDYEFEMLGDSAKGHLLCIWMLASRTKNEMPYDDKWITKKIGASTKVNLEALVLAGFLVVEQDASNTLHSTKHDATEYVPLEEERRGETEKRRDREEDKVSQLLDYSSWPSIPSDQVLKDWLSMRKRLKANVTQTVVNRLSKQLTIAHQHGFSVDECLSECQVRNWRGFEYEWIAKNQKPSMHDISSNDYKSGDL